MHDYQSVRKAETGLSRYFYSYNRERFHSFLENLTPEEVYLDVMRNMICTKYQASFCLDNWARFNLQTPGIVAPFQK